MLLELIVDMLQLYNSIIWTTYVSIKQLLKRSIGKKACVKYSNDYIHYDWDREIGPVYYLHLAFNSDDWVFWSSSSLSLVLRSFSRWSYWPKQEKVKIMINIPYVGLSVHIQTWIIPRLFHFFYSSWIYFICWSRFWTWEKNIPCVLSPHLQKWRSAWLSSGCVCW